MHRYVAFLLSALLLSPAATFAATANWNDNGTASYQNTGNIGIGTTTPTQKLVIEGGNILIRNTTPSLLLWTDITGGSEDGWTINNITNNLRIREVVAGVGADRFNIAPGGNIGIGTMTPTYKLDVVGTLRVSALASCASLATDASGGFICVNDSDTYSDFYFLTTVLLLCIIVLAVVSRIAFKLSYE